MENKHLSMTKYGPKGLNLVKYSISEELKQYIVQNNLLKALRLGVGVNEFYSLQKSYPFSKVNDKIFNYA